MKILILDDNKERHDAFALHLPDDERIHVWTHDEAVDALLNKGPFDLVFLDHDLNDFGKNSVMAGMYGTVELTGFDVARFIARELAENLRPPEVIVHSWNPPGAFMMVGVLREAGIKTCYRPFHGTPQGPLIEEDAIEEPD